MMPDTQKGNDPIEIHPSKRAFGSPVQREDDAGCENNSAHQIEFRHFARADLRNFATRYYEGGEESERDVYEEYGRPPGNG